MASPAANSEMIDVSQTPTLININMTNHKCKQANLYQLHHVEPQVHALFDGYDLAGYLDEYVLIPPSTITTDGQTSSNPAYLLWKRHDRLIYSALLRAISTSLQPLLYAVTMSSHIWDTLQSTYAKPSRDHFKQLKAAAQPLEEIIQIG